MKLHHIREGKPPTTLQVDVAPEQQPAASSVASETNMTKLAELTQPKAATEPAPSSTLRSRSSGLALGSAPASVYEDAPSRPASEPGALEDATSGDAKPGEAAASKAVLGERFLAEAATAAQLPDQEVVSPRSRASGLLKYRAPTVPAQRSKLESFDRKIGRATNSLKVSPFHRSSQDDPKMSQLHCSSMLLMCSPAALVQI